MERRKVLKLSAAAGTAGVLTLDSVAFASPARTDGPGDSAGEERKTVRGTLPTGAPDYVYLPVEVPDGVREIAVSYGYDKPQVPAGTPGNALDIGIFDERGTRLGGRGFRGWSGGFRTEFAISAERATPGYLPGPVRPGTWHVVLGPYTVAPQGLSYEVTVTLRYGKPGRTPAPSYPPERVRGRGRDWYRGDCHLHTVHSDGKRTPGEVAAAARAAGLDFLATTEHNTTSGHAAWAGLWGEDLLILCGEEVTTRNGHYLALGTEPGTFVDWRYRARDDAYERYVRQIHRAGGLVVPAHPNCPFVGCQWKFGYEGADAVEVWNGPWTPDDELSVAAWDNTLVADDDWLPAMGSSDAHREGQEVGLPQTVVRAEDLSRRALLEGMRKGRSYLAESSAVTLKLSATGPRGEHAGIGESLGVPADAAVTVRLEVTGAPSGATVRLLTDQGQLHAEPVPGGSATVSWRTTASLARYVRAELRHPVRDGDTSGLPGPMAAMTNPLWLTARD
ncbi:CehA/McbA family metallohydrolase [Streptomyces sp. N2-109]|uniref:CehA/McbA family metallohydrolase n=1 Tax=Streptomyces gossypii TaxID=2883101 RepID=A0ABT2K3J9_9ACTN|nr:CehA/McbA family metallohydrolase [Streptomyces gossypii]MCT2594750.1 CehA/McbA family metallohydrolase [Streptomyces gossypii]